MKGRHEFVKCLQLVSLVDKTRRRQMMMKWQPESTIIITVLQTMSLPLGGEDYVGKKTSSCLNDAKNEEMEQAGNGGPFPRTILSDRSNNKKLLELNHGIFGCTVDSKR